MAFAVEFVGIANHFLFYALRTIVAFGDRQFLPLDLFDGNTGTGVPFGNQRMFGQSLSAQQFGAEVAVLDVCMRTVAIDFRCVAVDNSDVVQHSGFFHKAAVHQPVFLPLRMAVYDLQRTVCHLPAMRQQYMPQLRLLRVVFVYEREIVCHCFVVSMYAVEEGFGVHAFLARCLELQDAHCSFAAGDDDVSFPFKGGS